MEASSKIRIVLVIWNIQKGGAERVLSILANLWAQRGWDVHVLTLESIPRRSGYELHSSVKIHPVGSDISTDGKNNRRFRIPITMRLRSKLRDLRPDAVVSFMDRINIKVLLATWGTNIPVFVCEHCDPRTRPIGHFNELLRRWLYPLARSVVVLSNEALSFFPPGIQARGSVIPNPVLPSPVSGSVCTRNAAKASKRIISMGRLCPVKRFDRLIEAFGRVADMHPSWSLEIWGEGPERGSLQKTINELNLGQKVRLCGVTDDVYQVLETGDLFALTSETEGFPMALCEAMACGLPVISMDCPSGPRQIVRSGVDGVLTPNGDLNAFSAGLDRLMSDENERFRLGQRASDVVDRFSVDSVINKWDQLFALYKIID
jgi:GalNAc-alpha-(1->4)-GalNAc-alpha-(1->3)-diNAcBac-PP-undecaprenol alpha-1,4-N-acetyl-D-galactosaminyltransferase